MVRLHALFSDYDGTLCPLEIRREDAYVTPKLRHLLTVISKTIKFGMVTTKDLDFVVDRIPFASGYAATCGLEMQVDDRVFMDERLHRESKIMSETYEEVVSKILHIKDNIIIERKENSSGNLIAFCIDWRTSHNWEEVRQKIAPILDSCRRRLFVVESSISPFANVFPFHVDKGTAYRRLRKELDVTGPALYLGDSEVDDPAFQLADISVGVKHSRTIPPLKCKYMLEFHELESFLTDLIDANLDFNDDMLARNVLN